MKRNVFSLVVICVFFWSLIFLATTIPPPNPTTKKSGINIGTRKEEEKPKPGNPKTLLIPKLQIGAPIEPVSLDGEGKMAVPTAAENVGWYSLGLKPGEKGSAVLAGHLDKVDGTAAVFYNLHQLEAGDRIIVIDDKEMSYEFLVTEKRIYGFDQVPMRDVFANFNYPGLNLITCGGNFNYMTGNYSHRSVVYSKLVQ
jgi:sortase (surface protein transpeptidase)